MVIPAKTLETANLSSNSLTASTLSSYFNPIISKTLSLSEET